MFTCAFLNLCRHSSRVDWAGITNWADRVAYCGTSGSTVMRELTRDFHQVQLCSRRFVVRKGVWGLPWSRLPASSAGTQFACVTFAVMWKKQALYQSERLAAWLNQGSLPCTSSIGRLVRHRPLLSKNSNILSLATRTSSTFNHAHFRVSCKIMLMQSHSQLLVVVRRFFPISLTRSVWI